MRLYVVSADTYNASWGTQISILVYLMRII